MFNQACGEQTVSTERPRLIVADDDPVVRALLGFQLRDAFGSVGSAADAEAAVALAKRHRPDLVILDVNMPGGGAKRATREISAQCPDTAIVILSADETDADIVELMAAGAVTYLRKGIKAPALIAKLRVAIDAHRTLQAAPHPSTVSGEAPVTPGGGSPAGRDPEPGIIPVRVVIADDDPFARLAVQAMIDRSDRLDFVGGAEGVEGVVDLVAAQRPDVVLLDWMMPGGGGPEAARRISSDRPELRIVALTSSASLQASREMHRAGAHGFLVKGCSAESLVHTIDTVVGAAA